MSIPRRLGRLARGFVSGLQEDERFRDSLGEALRVGRERGETLRGAFGAAWRGASEEWRTSEERRAREEAPGGRSGEGRTTSGWRTSAATFAPRRYPPEILRAYERLGLGPGASLAEADRKRRELVKKYHPDRFTNADKRRRAERVTAEINAAHDRIERYLLKRSRL